jgi:A/G-specific adenine glycosylase
MSPSTDQTNQPEATWLRRFRRRLLSWYRRHARDLPWRNTHDAYSIWVSEIMLQQTQVATVMGYYERFLARFPEVTILAAAEEEEVLRYWEGLGYYRRARQLHAAARLIVSQHQGQFPTSYQEVLALPGIGRYTAGAILSFALDRKLPIVEANTQRLYCRLLALREEATSAASQRRLWQFAEDLLPTKKIGEFNQALIELGATVCLPRNPKCSACPAMNLCPTFAGNLQEQIPAAKRRLVYEDRHEAAVVVYKRNKVLLRKCADGQRWAGLWDFPRFVIEADTGATDVTSQLSTHLSNDFKLNVSLGEHLTTIRHGVTKYRITLDCYRGQWRSGKLKRGETGEVIWCDVKRLIDYPLSVTGRKISELLVES